MRPTFDRLNLLPTNLSNRFFYGSEVRILPGNKKADTRVPASIYEYGAPGRIRTSDHLVRSQVLYPTELRALNSGAQLCRKSHLTSTTCFSRDSGFSLNPTLLGPRGLDVQAQNIPLKPSRQALIPLYQRLYQVFPEYLRTS